MASDGHYSSTGTSGTWRILQRIVVFKLQNKADRCRWTSSAQKSATAARGPEARGLSAACARLWLVVTNQQSRSGPVENTLLLCHSPAKTILFPHRIIPMVSYFSSFFQLFHPDLVGGSDISLHPDDRSKKNSSLR